MTMRVCLLLSQHALDPAKNQSDTDSILSQMLACVTLWWEYASWYSWTSCNIEVSLHTYVYHCTL